jgi:hypothetical protein
LLVDPVQARVEAQVLVRGQLAVEQRLVAEQSDAPAHLPGVIDQVAAEHAHAAGVRAQQRGEHAQQRGLAGAVGPEHDERVSGGERQRDVAERLAFAVAANQPVHLECGLAHAFRPAWGHGARRLCAGGHGYAKQANRPRTFWTTDRAVSTQLPAAARVCDVEYELCTLANRTAKGLRDGTQRLAA